MTWVIVILLVLILLQGSNTDSNVVRVLREVRRR